MKEPFLGWMARDGRNNPQVIHSEIYLKSLLGESLYRMQIKNREPVIVCPDTEEYRKLLGVEYDE